LILASLILLQEDWILARKTVSQGKIVISCSFLIFTLFLKSLFITFNIFGEQIFPTNFIVISKVIDPFLRKESDFVESFRYELFFTPIYIPIFIISLFVVPQLHAFLDAVGEVGLELDFVTNFKKEYKWTG